MQFSNSDKPVNFCSLGVIISVGYRVKSLCGIQFRIWATQVLHAYMQKGFEMNDDLLSYLLKVNWKDKQLLQNLQQLLLNFAGSGTKETEVRNTRYRRRSQLAALFSSVDILGILSVC